MRAIFILARPLLFAGAILLPAFAGNQILLRNFSPSDGSPALLVAGTKGQLLVVSTLTAAGQQISRVVELDLTGARLASIALSQLQSPAAAVVDSQGNLIVAGQDQSQNGIVMRVNSQLQSVASLASLPARINALTVDSSGNIYLTGITDSASFPVTPGAYQTTPPAADNEGTAAFAFLTILSSSGNVTYSTYFGGDATDCIGGSFCIGKFGVTTGTAIALNASGAVVIAGTTTSSALPTTPGALAATCMCGYDVGYGVPSPAGFVARFQPSASPQLQWSTYLNGGFSPMPFTLTGLALDSSGNPIVAGSAPTGLPVTAGAFQITPASNPTSGAYLFKLNNSGTAVIWGTYFDTPNSGAQAVLVDSQGRVVFSGYSGLSTFVGRISNDGSTLTDFFPGPSTAAVAGPALAITSTGGFASALPNSALWIETTSSGPSLLNIANSASGQYSSAVTGVELVTLYGVGIGPQTPLSGVVLNGAYTTSLGGCQVLVRGTAAPLLFAGPNQINAVIPQSVIGSAQIQVVTPAGTIAGPTVAISTSAIPAIFQNAQTGLAAALNQDGSVNSPANPAAAGSIVSVFATADSDNYFADGAVIPMAVYNATTSVWVYDTNRSLEVAFAGNAPGIVNGVMQINFLLPPTAPAGGVLQFTVQIAGVPAAQTAIAVAQ